MKYLRLLIIANLFFACQSLQQETTVEETVFLGFGYIAGEVTQQSVILQTQLTADSVATPQTLGKQGFVKFEIATQPDFSHSLVTQFLPAQAEQDYIVKQIIQGLTPNTQYYYRAIYGTDSTKVKQGKTATFRTLPDKESPSDFSFVVSTCMHYERFMYGSIDTNQGKKAYQGADKALGFVGLQAIFAQKPNAWILNGDNVYYDHSRTSDEEFIDVPAMRVKWKQLFQMPRFQQLAATTPTYWLKDDHDFRYDDGDTTDTPKKSLKVMPKPTVAEGIAIFREQVPVVNIQDKNAVTYRTYRINKDLQIWLVENRDYRSPNLSKDTVGKSIWGEKQKKWLKETLLESSATYKILISPTPMVGPDDARKIDNHANVGGFSYEGNEFFNWLKSNNISPEQFFVICGDRHWQYHSIHPTGYHELSNGSLTDQNSRKGRKPGDPESSDPNALIQQPFLQETPTGGFIKVSINKASQLTFTIFDDEGNVLHEHKVENSL